VQCGLGGPGSRACHVLDESVNYNAILGTGGNGCAIRCNWGVNHAFLKFPGGGGGGD
jgi:hypothetical protein